MKYSKWWKARTYNHNYSARLSFAIEGEIKSFLDKEKLKEIVTTKSVLPEMLKGLQEKEEEGGGGGGGDTQRNIKE